MVYNGGTLNLSGCYVTENKGADAGGIYSSGTLDISSSQIVFNHATDSGGKGGGIYIAGGTCSIHDSSAITSCIGSA